MAYTQHMPRPTPSPQTLLVNCTVIRDGVSKARRGCVFSCCSRLFYLQGTANWHFGLHTYQAHTSKAVWCLSQDFSWTCRILVESPPVLVSEPLAEGSICSCGSVTTSHVTWTLVHRSYWFKFDFSHKAEAFDVFISNLALIISRLQGEAVLSIINANKNSSDIMWFLKRIVRAILHGRKTFPTAQRDYS